MDAEELVEQINDFLPLLPENIKQELLDNNDKTNPCDSAENKVRLSTNFMFSINPKFMFTLPITTLWAPACTQLVPTKVVRLIVNNHFLCLHFTFPLHTIIGAVVVQIILSSKAFTMLNQNSWKLFYLFVLITSDTTTIQQKFLINLFSLFQHLLKQLRKIDWIFQLYYALWRCECVSLRYRIMLMLPNWFIATIF